MAERRMFSKSIVNSARFLRMPQTSRLLYYDLGMAADDDGIVEAFTVLRTTGAAEDDLRVLASKGFVTVLNEDLVSFITDWSRNNYIQKDRYRPSIYAELLVRISDEGDLDTACIQSVSKMDTQVRLGEDSIGKASLGQVRECGPETESDNEKSDFEIFWASYPRKIHLEAAKEEYMKIDVSQDVLLKSLETFMNSQDWKKEGGRYIPAPDKWLRERRWNSVPIPVGTEEQFSPGQAELDAVRQMAERKRKRDGHMIADCTIETAKTVEAQQGGPDPPPRG